MPNDIFDFSVAVFLRGHGILAELLRKAEAHAAERKIAPTGGYGGSLTERDARQVQHRVRRRRSRSRCARPPAPSRRWPRRR